MTDVSRSGPLEGPHQQPKSVSEAGVHKGLLENLALKIIFLSGPLSLVELSEHLRLGLEVTDELFRRLRAEHLCEVTGMSGNIHIIAISSTGRLRALELLSLNQYAGPAPVSLESYAKQVRQQSVLNAEVHPSDVERAFSHLTVDSEILWQLGAALNSGAPIFLYGPSGVGKTTIAETLSRVLTEGKVWIPYAVEVDGQIIAVYDPLIHESSAEPALSNSDARWVLCSRPAVQVGGELTGEMLDLQFNPITKFYAAPIQMKANNGVLIVDDFGRQRMQPEALLNRWVVPLDRRIDFLNLTAGRTVKIPFETLVVFATNLDPAVLLEDAFLRRIQTKIKVDAASEHQFCDIFRRVADDRGLAYDEEVPRELADDISRLGHTLRQCYPRDIVNRICWAAKYENKEPKLDRASMKRAVKAYFLRTS